MAPGLEKHSSSSPDTEPASSLVLRRPPGCDGAEGDVTEELLGRVMEPQALLGTEHAHHPYLTRLCSLPDLGCPSHYCVTGRPQARRARAHTFPPSLARPHTHPPPAMLTRDTPTKRDGGSPQTVRRRCLLAVESRSRFQNTQ